MKFEFLKLENTRFRVVASVSNFISLRHSLNVSVNCQATNLLASCLYMCGVLSAPMLTSSHQHDQVWMTDLECHPVTSHCRVTTEDCAQKTTSSSSVFHPASCIQILKNLNFTNLISNLKRNQTQHPENRQTK